VRAAAPVLIRLLRPCLRPYSAQIAAVVTLFALQGLGNLYLPRLNADLIDNGIAMGDTSHILALGGIMLCVTVAQCVIAVIALYWATRTSAGIGKDLRAAVFASIQAFSRAELNRFGVTSLINRNTNDIQQVQLFLQTALTLMVVAPIICVGGLIMAIAIDAALAKLLVVVIPVMVAAIAGLLIVTVPLFRSMQAGIDRISQLLREQITGARVIRAFSRTSAERQRFDAANSDLTAIALRVNRIFVLAIPALTAVLNLAVVAVLWFGGRLVGQAALPIGNLTALVSYILQILMSVMAAATMVILIPRAVASAERIHQVLCVVPSVAAPRHPVAPAAGSGTIEFHEVWFQHPGGAQPVLRDLTIAFQPGETTAIIGGTGSGKSTLLGLIPRLLDATSGQVAVDGVDVRLQAPHRLRAAIGLAPQEAFLFGGTVAGNLRFAKPTATDAELWQALQTAQLSDFVTCLPHQLDTAIDQGATNLAGGQRQRLSIARVLLARPRIYLIDDCFPALDGATEARLRAALREATAGATVVMATQRVAVAADADQIIVLDDGRVAGIGDHRQLLAHCATYQEIVTAQFSEEVAG
jgi:ATP-binding cassette, subfamily B, multidrug efflux pump